MFLFLFRILFKKVINQNDKAGTSKTYTISLPYMLMINRGPLIYVHGKYEKKMWNLFCDQEKFKVE